MISDTLPDQDKCGGMLHTGNAAVHILLQTVSHDVHSLQEPFITFSFYKIDAPLAHEIGHALAEQPFEHACAEQDVQLNPQKKLLLP